MHVWRQGDVVELHARLHEECGNDQGSYHDPRRNGGSTGFYGAFKIFCRGSTDSCGGSVWSIPLRATLASWRSRGIRRAPAVIRAVTKYVPRRVRATWVETIELRASPPPSLRLYSPLQLFAMAKARHSILFIRLLLSTYDTFDTLICEFFARPGCACAVRARDP